jgi:threonine dehydrogenase-like Zn-dependent dehydrogenase
MRELQLIKTGQLEWREREAPALVSPTDAIVRPFVAGRCDGDALPLHRRVSRPMQVGMHTGLIDPVVGTILGPVPFQGPFGIGHECVAQVVTVGEDVTAIGVGQVVVVPWAVSCGECLECSRGLTAKCATTRESTLAAYGFGPASGPWGGMIVDELRVPFADHMLVPVPDGVDPLRVAAAGDNLGDAWRAVVPPLRQREGGSVLVLGGERRASACTRPGSPSVTAPRWSTTSTTARSGWRSRQRSARERTGSQGAAGSRRPTCFRSGMTSPSRRPPAEPACAPRCAR